MGNELLRACQWCSGEKTRDEEPSEFVHVEYEPLIDYHAREELLKSLDRPELVEMEASTPSNFNEKFVLGEKLGEGAFAAVYHCVSRSSDKVYAVKKTTRANLDRNTLYCTLMEPFVLRKIYHPNIMIYTGFFKDDRFYYMVCEELTGGAVSDILEDVSSHSEKEICRLVQQLLLAIQHIHARNIVHRDLKLDNLMLDASGVLKIVDFGCADQVESDEPSLSKVLGTPGYMAPEIIKNQLYGKRVDLWSAGVIIYSLLCGYPPFHHDYVDELDRLFRIICSGFYIFDSPYWDNISTDAKDLIKHLLVVNPEFRYTATQALKHPWFNQLEEIEADPINLLPVMNIVQKFTKRMMVVTRRESKSVMQRHVVLKKLKSFSTDTKFEIAIPKDSVLLSEKRSLYCKTKNRSNKGAQQHRRSRSIAVGSIAERMKIAKEHEVDVLHTELEKQKSALKESKEEAKLAAEIGQSLLRQTETMDKSFELTQHELSSQLSEAQNEIQHLTEKYNELLKQKKQVENMANSISSDAETTEEANAQLTTEIEHFKQQIKRLQVENSTISAETHRMDYKLTESLDQQASLRIALQDSKRQLDQKKQYIQEMEKKLQDQVDSTCNVDEIIQLAHEKCNGYFAENEELKQVANEHEQLIQSLQGEKKEAEESGKLHFDRLNALECEKEQVSSLLKESQELVRSLTKSNQELRAEKLQRHDSQQLLLTDRTGLTPPDTPTKPRYRKGSLFSELQQATEGEKSSVKRSGSLVSLLWNNTEPSAMTLTTGTQTISEKPSRRLSEETQKAQDKELKHVDILQEFFVLTATAIKVNGGGLHNGMCSISNEALYEEASDAGISFDQYHSWLDCRLNGKPWEDN